MVPKKARRRGIRNRT